MKPILIFICVLSTAPIAFADGYGSHGPGTFSAGVDDGLNSVFIANKNIESVVAEIAENTLTDIGLSSTNVVVVDTTSVGIVTNNFMTYSSGAFPSGSNEFSYVWNGILPENYSDSAGLYGSHASGTFNINPEGDFAGVWVGNQTMADIANSNLIKTFNGLHGPVMFSSDTNIIFLTNNTSLSINFLTNGISSIRSLNSWKSGDMLVTNGPGISIDSSGASSLSVENTGIVKLKIEGSESAFSGNVYIQVRPVSYGSGPWQMQLSTNGSSWTPVFTYTNMSACIDLDRDFLVNVNSAKSNSLSVSGQKLDQYSHYITLSPHVSRRVVTTSSTTATIDDKFIWFDSDTANRTQTLTLHSNTNEPCQSIVVYHLGSTYPANVVHGTNTYTLSGDGESMVFDWLAYRTNWYPRPNY